MSETEFETFVAENYDCNLEYEDVNKKGARYTGKKTAIQVQTTQETAFAICNKLIDEMEKKKQRMIPVILVKTAITDYGLWMFRNCTRTETIR